MKNPSDSQWVAVLQSTKKISPDTFTNLAELRNKETSLAELQAVSYNFNLKGGDNSSLTSSEGNEKANKSWIKLLNTLQDRCRLNTFVEEIEKFQAKHALYLNAALVNGDPFFQKIKQKPRAFESKKNKYSKISFRPDCIHLFDLSSNPANPIIYQIPLKFFLWCLQQNLNEIVRYRKYLHGKAWQAIEGNILPISHVHATKDKKNKKQSKRIAKESAARVKLTNSFELPYVAEMSAFCKENPQHLVIHRYSGSKNFQKFHVVDLQGETKEIHIVEMNRPLFIYYPKKSYFIVGDLEGTLYRVDVEEMRANKRCSIPLEQFSSSQKFWRQFSLRATFSDAIMINDEIFYHHRASNKLFIYQYVEEMERFTSKVTIDLPEIKGLNKIQFIPSSSSNKTYLLVHQNKGVQLWERKRKNIHPKESPQIATAYRFPNQIAYSNEDQIALYSPQDKVTIHDFKEQRLTCNIISPYIAEKVFFPSSEAMILYRKSGEVNIFHLEKNEYLAEEKVVFDVKVKYIDVQEHRPDPSKKKSSILFALEGGKYQVFQVGA